MEHNHSNQVRVKSIGIDAYCENIIYMRHDCHVCPSEVPALPRLVLRHKDKDIIATLNVIHNSELLRSLILIQFTKSLNLIKQFS